MTKSDTKAERLDEVVNETANAAETTAKSLKDGVSSIASSAQAQADATADQIASSVDRASSTLRNAASSLRDGSFQERSFGQLAAGLADAADAIRDKDLGQLGRDVSGFAKRNPVVFVGGAALLGYAVARMMADNGDRS
ncbi:hypothetical protein E4Z66_00795 [Aliishimia ponticola]|uniref:DUF883 family protein n=1 Tax=Aliishimia ponticola TaxID=2499833 RepID=A0A4S4NF11_9RHOB|nr:hypothetical protein [Aliishimia ponticola]THH38146.1 hypothetical protein E4Z66_00795 [Aliishimia ponticola]